MPPIGGAPIPPGAGGKDAGAPKGASFKNFVNSNFIPYL